MISFFRSLIGLPLYSLPPYDYTMMWGRSAEGDGAAGADVAGEVEQGPGDGRLRWAQPGPPDFEAAAQEHAQRGHHPPENPLHLFERHADLLRRFRQLNPDPDPDPGTYYARVIPLLLQNLAQQHPLTAVAALGFVGGLTLAGMGFAGLRMGRWMFARHRPGALRHARGHGAVPLNIQLEDLERRVIQEIERLRAAHHEGIAQVLNAAYRDARAREAAAAQPGHQEPGMAEQMQREAEELRREAGTPPPPPPYPAEGRPDVEHVPADTVRNLMTEMRGLRGEVGLLRGDVATLLRKLEELSERLPPAVRDDQGPDEDDAPAPPPPPPPPPSGGQRGSSIPSANNVDLTGPVLAQTRQVNNVPPEDIPGSSGSDGASVPSDSSSAQTATEPAPKTTDTSSSSTGSTGPSSTGDMTMSEIAACVGDIQRQYKEYNTAESDSSAKSVTPKDVDAAPVTSDVTRASQSANESAPASETKDNCEQSAKATGAAEVSEPESWSNVSYRSDGSWDPVDIQEAIQASRREAAGMRKPSELGARDGEAGPSGWRGGRVSTDPSAVADEKAPAPDGDTQSRQIPALRSGIEGRPTRMSFRLLQEIDLPIHNEWITVPIRLVEARYDDQSYSGWGGRYERQHTQVRRHLVPAAELYVASDVSLLRLDGRVWQCAFENGEYVVGERVG